MFDRGSQKSGHAHAPKINKSPHETTAKINQTG
jgi:hypothetical protein